MDEQKIVFTTYEQYVEQFPTSTTEVLHKIRAAIRDAVPEATEKISYAMPTYALHGNFIHFAAFKKHIGLYPGPKAVEHFKERLDGNKYAKGTIQFPLNKPMPYSLITEIATYSAAQNFNKHIEKQANKKK